MKYHILFCCLLLSVASFVTPIKVSSQDIVSKVQGVLVGDSDTTAQNLTRFHAPWGFYSQNSRTSSDDLWITRIAFLDSPATYRVCRSAASSFKISSPVIVYVDGKAVLSANKPHSLDSGSCIVVTGKVIDLEYSGANTFNHWLSGSYVRIDSQNLTQTFGYDKLGRWQSNWQRGVTPQFHRTPITYDSENDYRICFDGQEQDTTVPRTNKPNWSIEFDSGEAMPPHPSNEVVTFQSGSCIDIDGKNVSVFPQSEPQGYDWYFMIGHFYVMDPEPKPRP